MTKSITSKDMRKPIVLDMFKKFTNCSRVTAVSEDKFYIYGSCHKYDKASGFYDRVGRYKIHKDDIGGFSRGSKISKEDR